LFAVRIVGLDTPIIVCDSNDLEANFCFCHKALCTRLIESESTDVRAMGPRVQKNMQPAECVKSHRCVIFRKPSSWLRVQIVQ
jgi:hypothetical protein